MKVCQFMNKNQFEIRDNNKLYLQSYYSLVVEISNGKIILGRDWDYSTTTSKHVYAFLKEYSNIGFYGVKNKRAYVNKLIKEGKIEYNENMY